MSRLKIFLCLVFIFAAAVIPLRADALVDTENKLKDAISDPLNPKIIITNSFDFVSDLTVGLPFNRQKTFLEFLDLRDTSISGADLYKGFEFTASTFSLKGFAASTSTFHSFYSAASSGAVINISSRSYVSMQYVAFTSNTALNGGVLYSSDTVLDISSATFNLNTAIASGGAFYIEYSTANLQGVYAASNTAAGYGGFMFADQSSFTITKSTISENMSDFGGGVSVSSSHFILNDVYFASNTATSNGGALYAINGSTFSVVNSTFTGNIAAEGGAAYLVSMSSGFMKNVYFTSNTASGNGGGLYLKDSWDISINDSYFSFNETAQSGGAFYVSGSSEIYLNNIEWRNNTASANGGALFADSSALYLTTLYAVNNSADSGGAFYLQNSTSIIGGATFESNTAQTLGGALYLISSSATLNSSSFSGNQAGSSGGALYIEDGKIFVQAVQFIGNTAGADGGAAYIKGSAATFSDVSFSGNSSQNGGAIFVNNSTVTVNGGAFANNTATVNGGAFYVSGNSELVLNAAKSVITFTSNTAGGSANDIYLEDNSKLTLNAQNDIILNGGLAHAASPSSIVINKTGSGSLRLGGNNTIECDFNLMQGGLVLNENSSLSINQLNVTSGNMFTAGRNSSVNVTGTLDIASGGSLTLENATSFDADTLNMYGTLTIGVDLQNGTSDKITANTVNLNSASSLLKLGGNLGKGSDTFTIIDATVLNGDFSVLNGAYGARTSWSLTKTGGEISLFVESLGYDEIRGLNYNQQQAANLINKDYDAIYNADGGLWKNVISPMDALGLSDLQKALETLSGSFYADLFKVAAVNNQKHIVFEQIRNQSIADENSWIQASGSLLNFKKGDYTSNDFEDTNWGVKAGWDLINNEGLVGGLSVGYQNHDITRADEGALINGFDAGAYGGLVGEIFELKGIFSLGYQSFETEREIKSLNTKAARGNFSGYSAALDAQVACDVMLSNIISFKPFFEIGAAAALNDKVEEEGGDFSLKIDSQNYFYSDALLGIGFNGYHEKVTWYINGGVGYTLAGAQNEIETELVQASGKMTVKGAQQGDMTINAGCGAEVAVHEQVYVYANGGYGTADGYDNIYANAGVRYKFLR